MTGNNQDARTNVLILGKTGAGKSSLLNYLLGDEAAEVGHGRPTSTEGIHQHNPFEYNGVSFVIYDSWGLEADKAIQWKQLVNEEVKKNNAKEVRDWFHTILYCVDAERARVEDFEIRKVLWPLIEDGNHVLFALTKAGLSETNTRATREVLEAEFPGYDMVEIESVSAKLIGKPPTIQNGRDDLLSKVCRNLWGNIANKAIDKYKRDTRDVLKERLPSETLEYFKKKAGPLGFFIGQKEKFKDDVPHYVEQKALSILAETGAQLKENMLVGKNIASDAYKSFENIGMPFVNIALNRMVRDNFETGENHMGHLSKTIINQTKFFPVALPLRKLMLRDIEVKLNQLVNDIEKEIARQAEILREKLGVKKWHRS